MRNLPASGTTAARTVVSATHLPKVPETVFTGLAVRLRPGARSRITTAYMTIYFLGGAVGSVLASYAYTRLSGCRGVVELGIALSVTGFLLWFGEQVARDRTRQADPQ